MWTCEITACTFPAVSISLVGRDFVEVTESNSTLTFELEVTGLSFGVVPLRVVAVSYGGLEELRESFGIESTLEDIAGSDPLPSVSALPCELTQLQCCSCLTIPCRRSGLQWDTAESGVHCRPGSIL